MSMGCCLRKTAPVRITVTEAPDYPLRIRLRLRGELKEASSDKIGKKLCEITSENERRFKVELTERDDSYFATVNILEGDPPGTSRKIAKRIIDLIVGRGVTLTENLKLIGAKEHLLAAEL